MTRNAIFAGAIALAVVGTTSAVTVACIDRPAPARTDRVVVTPGVPIGWDTYVAVVTGHGPPDTACHPHDLTTLMLPCDTGGR